MRWNICSLLLALTALCGCSPQISPQPRTAEEDRLFGPVSMKLDTFSKVRDWNNDNVPDGIEALIEFDDRPARPRDRRFNRQRVVHERRR